MPRGIYSVARDAAQSAEHTAREHTDPTFEAVISPLAKAVRHLIDVCEIQDVELQELHKRTRAGAK